MFNIRHESFGYKISYDGYAHNFQSELEKLILDSDSYHISERDLRDACMNQYHQISYPPNPNYISFTFMIAETPRSFTGTHSRGITSQPIIPPPKLNTLLLLL